MLWLVIATGGAIGAVARHAMNLLVHRYAMTSVPAGIFVVNAVGCFAMGLLAGLLASSRLQIGEVSRSFLIVGVLGGFTTFSSYSLDTYTLIRGGHHALALLNAAGQVLVGLAALWVGFAAGAWRT